jgi:hypothetical protein
MKRLLHLLTLCALLLAPAAHGPAWAQGGDAEALMKKSGLWQQLDSLAPQVRAGMLAAMDKAGARPSAEEQQRLGQAVDESYAAARLRGVAGGVIAQGLEPRHLNVLNRWYDGALGRRITLIEEAAAADATPPDATMQQGQALLEAMPSTRRAALAGIVEATKSAELMVSITINTVLATQRGVASVLPQGQQGPTQQELRALLDAGRERMQDNFSAYLVAAMARTYAELPTPELTQYLDFLRGDAGRHFSDITGRALDAAITDASAELGRRLPGTRDGARS